MRLTGVRVLSVPGTDYYMQAFKRTHTTDPNTLVMLIAIFTGGVLWGMAGMILFVPFAGIAKLIADHNPKWKTPSMILGK